MTRCWNASLNGPPPRMNNKRTSPQPKSTSAPMSVDTDEGVESDNDCEYDEYTLAQNQPPHRCFSLWCKCDLSSENPPNKQTGLAKKDVKKPTNIHAAIPRQSGQRN